MQEKLTVLGNDHKAGYRLIVLKMLPIGAAVEFAFETSLQKVPVQILVK